MTPIEPWWWWLGAGLVLAALEMLAPGIYLIWLALAALATGLLVLASEPSLPFQIVSFVSLALIFVYSSRRMLRDQPIASSDPLMNDRVGRLVGQTALVSEAITGGKGRIRVGDSDWLASGPDCAAGTRVRIAGAEGACLRVEAIKLGTIEGASRA